MPPEHAPTGSTNTPGGSENVILRRKVASGAPLFLPHRFLHLQARLVVQLTRLVAIVLTLAGHSEPPPRRPGSRAGWIGDAWFTGRSERSGSDSGSSGHVVSNALSAVRTGYSVHDHEKAEVLRLERSHRIVRSGRLEMPCTLRSWSATVFDPF
jgi:hypothetical protein